LNRFSASISGASARVRLPAEWQLGEVGLIGCDAVKARMRSTAIVEVEVAMDRGAGVADAVIGSKIDLLVFDAAPHRDIGDVHRPHLVRPCDRHVAQQIRVDLVAGLPV
jgi:hypothetical protein